MLGPKPVYCNALLASLNARGSSDSRVNAITFSNSTMPSTGFSSSVGERRLPIDIVIDSSTTRGYPSSGLALKDGSTETMDIGYDGKEVGSAV